MLFLWLLLLFKVRVAFAKVLFFNKGYWAKNLLTTNKIDAEGRL